MPSISDRAYCSRYRFECINLTTMPRHKLFETPEELEEAFIAYKEWVKANPRTRMVFVGKDGDKQWEHLERPLTYEGFKSYCYENHSDVHHYFENTEGRYEAFGEVCSRIKNEIRRDQIEGGMVGQYNASITQRLNGLKEQSETVNTTSINILNIDPLDDSTDNRTS